MVEQVAVLRADDRVVVHPLDGERVGFLPFALFPEATALGDFADVDLWVEVRGELVAVVAGVGVHDVDRLNRVEEVLLGVGAEDVGHAGVEARAEEGGEASLLEACAVGPLPGVFELREVGRLVVGRVDVVDAGVEAGVHQVEVLVG